MCENYLKAIKISLVLLLLAVQGQSAFGKMSSRLNTVEKEVKIDLADGISISGTMLEPANPKPVLVILVTPPLTGDRNFSRQNAPDIFKALAENLAQDGYSVYRFDHRGRGASDGITDSVSLYTHAADLSEIVRFFKHSKRYKRNKLYLSGISEGGLVSEVVAAKSKDVSGLILLSSQGYGGYRIWQYQMKSAFKIAAKQYKQEAFYDSLFQNIDNFSKPLFEILEGKSTDSMKIKIRAYQTNALMTGTGEPWLTMRFGMEQFYNDWLHPQQFALKSFKPEKYLKNIKCPVLAMCGTRDDTMDCPANLDAIRNALSASGNTNITTVILPRVNQSYRTLKEGATWELEDRKTEKFSKLALDRISQWIEMRN